MRLLLILLPCIFMWNIEGHLDVDTLSLKLLTNIENQLTDLKNQQERHKLRINALKRTLQAEGINITNIAELVGEENENDPYGYGKIHLIQNDIWLLKTFQEQKQTTTVAEEIVKNTEINQVLNSKLKKENYNAKLPKNCAEIDKTGVHEIRTPPFTVACNADVHGGKWTVIQRRKDGSVDFYRPWVDYKAGFGDLNGEFFIGLENLHLMTTYEPQELLIIMEDYENVQKYAKYDSFAIGSELELYNLHTLGAFSGDAGDALIAQKPQNFTTYDRDNDIWINNCAQSFKGAWWYAACHTTNLNGNYGNNNFGQGINWFDWHGHKYSLKAVEMMIRSKS